MQQLTDSLTTTLIIDKNAIADKLNTHFVLIEKKLRMILTSFQMPFENFANRETSSIYLEPPLYLKFSCTAKHRMEIQRKKQSRNDKGPMDGA